MGSDGLSRAQPNIANIFAACMLTGVIAAVTQPWLFSWYNVDPNLSLGLAMLLIGHSIDLQDLLPPLPGTQGGAGLDLWVAGSVSSLLVFPAVGLMATCVAAAAGASTEVLVGLVVTAACPPGSASNLVPTRLSGLPVAPVAALCTLFTLTAAYTFPLALTVLTAALKLLLGINTSQGLWATLSWANAAPLAYQPFISHGLYSLLGPFALGFVSRTLLLTLLGRWAPSTAKQAVQVLPLLAPAGILITAANKLALNSSLTSSYPLVVAGVLAMHAAAYAVGYLLPWMAGASDTACKMASIQAGARNPAVGLTLAVALLGKGQPLALAPCAVSVWVQNVVGSLLTAWWTAQGKGAGRRSGKSGQSASPTRVQPPRRAKRA